MNDAASVDLTAASAAALQTFIASGVVLTCIALGGLAGLRTKFFRSIMGFASLVTAAAASFAWCDGAGRFIGAFGVPGGWTLVAGYTAVFAVVLAVMSVLTHVMVRTDVMTYFPIIDRVGGAVVGAASGILLASAVRVGFAMAPFAAAARPTPEQLQADVTPRILQIVSRILSSNTEFRRAWLHGRPKPLDDGAEGDETAWSEPYVDLNTNRRHDADEPFLDKDGNQTFTAAFAVADVADDDDMLIGVMDRYWLGNWRLVTVSKSNGEVNPAPADSDERPDGAGEPSG